MIPRTLTLSVAVALLATQTAKACDLDDFVGYTLIAAKYVSGYIDKDNKRSSNFEGCDWDRIIVFEDNTGVRCRGYSYSYSYRPKAYIFANGSRIKLYVNGRCYDAARVN